VENIFLTLLSRLTILIYINLLKFSRFSPIKEHNLNVIFIYVYRAMNYTTGYRVTVVCSLTSSRAPIYCSPKPICDRQAKIKIRRYLNFFHRKA